MKAISLWQPWATFMAMELKKNETRHWSTSHRGPLLIHAAKRRMTRSEFTEMRYTIDHHIGMNHLSYGMLYDLPYGAILCEVDLMECQQIGHDNCPKKNSKNWKERAEYFFGNYDHGRYMWKTNHVKAFDIPIPFKGSQGFFNVPNEIFP